MSECSNTYGRRVQIQCDACWALFILDLRSVDREKVEKERGEYWEQDKTDNHFWAPEDYYKKIRPYGRQE